MREFIYWWIFEITLIIISWKFLVLINSEKLNDILRWLYTDCFFAVIVGGGILFAKYLASGSYHKGVIKRKIRRVFKITDQKKLAEIAKADEYLKVCEAAVKRLTDQKLLAEVVKTAENYRIRAVAETRLSYLIEISATG